MERLFTVTLLVIIILRHLLRLLPKHKRDNVKQRWYKDMPVRLFHDIPESAAERDDVPDCIVAFLDDLESDLFLW